MKADEVRDPGEVVYTVDGDDRITSVNDGWTAFAAANDGGALLPPEILGRTLWECIHDPTTSVIYRQLLKRLRGGWGNVRFSCRCDAPARRRLLQIAITLDDNGAVTFRVRPVWEQDRSAIPFLDPAAPRSEVSWRMCAWCQRVPDVDGNWREVEDALPGLHWLEQPVFPLISHGICGDCEATMTAALDDPEIAASGAIVLGARAQPVP